MTGKELLDRIEKKLEHDVLGVSEVHGRWFLELGNRKTSEPLLMAGGFSVDLKTKEIIPVGSVEYIDEDWSNVPEYTYEEACKIELDD